MLPAIKFFRKNVCTKEYLHLFFSKLIRMLILNFYVPRKTNIHEFVNISDILQKSLQQGWTEF